MFDVGPALIQSLGPLACRCHRVWAEAAGAGLCDILSFQASIFSPYRVGKRGEFVYAAETRVAVRQCPD